MNIQLLCVIIALIAALVFMAKKFATAIKKKGCDCEKSCPSGCRKCAGGGDCKNQPTQIDITK